MRRRAVCGGRVCVGDGREGGSKGGGKGGKESVRACLPLCPRLLLLPLADDDDGMLRFVCEGVGLAVVA